MYTLNQAFYETRKKLLALYDEQEAAAITHELLTHLTGMDKLQRLMQKDELLDATKQEQFDVQVEALLKGTPLQYIIGEAWFMGRRFMVNNAVLIPRPETEELVEWIINDWKGKDAGIRILDIGTGSGCIPISLQLGLTDVKVESCDISADALEVARKNAEGLGAAVSFYERNFLDKEGWAHLPMYDVIVSNPPYIPEQEYEQIHTNVRDHEPWQALFVPDTDPQLFYRAIAEFGREHLKRGGAIYCELHKDYGLGSKEVFKELGYTHLKVREDMHGNLRMLKAMW